MIGSALYMPRGEEHCLRTEPLDEDILRETHSGITIRPLEALRVIRLFGQHRPDFSAARRRSASCEYEAGAGARSVSTLYFH